MAQVTGLMETSAMTTVPDTPTDYSTPVIKPLGYDKDSNFLVYSNCYASDVSLLRVDESSVVECAVLE